MRCFKVSPHRWVSASIYAKSIEKTIFHEKPFFDERTTKSVTPVCVALFPPQGNPDIVSPEQAAGSSSDGGQVWGARPGRERGVEVDVFVNARMKQSMSCWRSALVASMQAWKAGVGSSEILSD